MRYFVLMLFFVTTVSFGIGKTKTCTFDVSGMTCASCELTLKIAVKKLDGIDEVKASNAKKSAQIVFNPEKVSSKKIEEKINAVGYKAKLNQCNG